ncbi:hypothetical protein [Mastigocladopsis repens]|nr:hypothetical protein [Mastigocladopsis repens]
MKTTEAVVRLPPSQNSLSSDCLGTNKSSHKTSAMAVKFAKQRN